MLRTSLPRFAIILCLAACGGSGAEGEPDATPDGAGPGEFDSAYIFDPGQVRTYEFIVEPDDWQWLQDHALDEMYVPATLRVDGVEVESVGLRFKGAVGSLLFQGPVDGSGVLCFVGNQWIRENCPKLNMKASFNEYVPGRTFSGLKKLQFHAMANDDTKMVEHLSYWLFREMGVHAPRTAYARLIINGELQGFYTLVEQIDGRFTRERFADGGKGNLYKEVWPVHTTPAPYQTALRTNEDDPATSVDKMVRFAQEVMAADETSFAQVLERWTDVDMYMSYMAVARAIEHWDDITAVYCYGGGCSNHNYYWYESTVADKVWLIPWDMDRAMVWPSPLRSIYGVPDWDEVAPCDEIPVFFPGLSVLPPSCDPFLGLTARTLWDRYVAATESLLAGPFAEARIDARIDELSTLITGHVAEDPYIDSAAWQSRIEPFRQDLASMRAAITAKIQQ
jgi:spore coat protein H